MGGLMDLLEMNIPQRRLPTKIGGEYYLLPTVECLKYGIAGKLAEVKKRSETKGKYWVVVENDAYELEAKSMDPRIVRGLYKVDWGEILRSNLFQGVTLRIEKEREGKPHEVLKDMGFEMAIDPSKLGSQKEIDVLWVDVESVSIRLTKPYLIKSDGKLQAFSDKNQVLMSSTVEELTGKNLWHILKVLNLLEYSICGCGSTHQHWQEYQQQGVVQLKCADCSEVLFIATHSWPQKLERSLEKMVRANRDHTFSYLRMISSK